MLLWLWLETSSLIVNCHRHHGCDLLLIKVFIKILHQFFFLVLFFLENYCAIDVCFISCYFSQFFVICYFFMLLSIAFSNFVWMFVENFHRFFNGKDLHPKIYTFKFSLKFISFHKLLLKCWFLLPNLSCKLFSNLC